MRPFQPDSAQCQMMLKRIERRFGRCQHLDVEPFEEGPRQVFGTAEAFRNLVVDSVGGFEGKFRRRQRPRPTCVSQIRVGVPRKRCQAPWPKYARYSGVLSTGTPFHTDKAGTLVPARPVAAAPWLLLLMPRLEGTPWL